MVLKTDFQRSDENSQDPLNENFTEIDKYINDTGWLPLTLTSNFRPYGGDTSFSPEYRRIGKSVEIRGAIQPTTALEPGADVIIGVLPVGFRPINKSAYMVCHGSNKNTWLCLVDAAGNLKFSRYGASTNAVANTNIWLPFTIRYFVD